jgi:hypothetical protein
MKVGMKTALIKTEKNCAISEKCGADYVIEEIEERLKKNF